MSQSPLHVKPTAPDANGRVIHVTPESAGWTYVGFDLHHLAVGQTLHGETAERETLLYLVQGTLTARAGGEDFGAVGGRMDVFSREKPSSIYIPAGMAWEITATSPLELAVCTAPGTPGRPARIIGPSDFALVERGQGANQRFIHPVLMEDSDFADSLLVTEVYTPSGHWSSYPPHKHDDDNFPAETHLEETYYHRINPSQGFGYQRVYTDDRSLDESIAFENGDLVMVPRGYHPCGAPYGYDLYYLNVMAGPRRQWRFHNDPAHDWIFQRDTPKKQG